MFDLINTVTTNFIAIWDAPKDWSVNGGLSWLVFYGVACLVGFAVVCIRETQKERREARQALYRDAEAHGHLRNVRRDWRGYIEY